MCDELIAAMQRAAKYSLAEQRCIAWWINDLLDEEDAWDKSFASFADPRSAKFWEKVRKELDEATRSSHMANPFSNADVLADFVEEAGDAPQAGNEEAQATLEARVTELERMVKALKLEQEINQPMY